MNSGLLNDFVAMSPAHITTTKQKWGLSGSNSDSPEQTALR